MGSKDECCKKTTKCDSKDCCSKKSNNCESKKNKNCGINNSCFIIVLYILLAIILAGIIYY